MSPAPASDPAERIILALDRPDAAAALALAAAIPELRWVKVGLELFSAAGPAVVAELRDRGHQPLATDLSQEHLRTDRSESLGDRAGKRPGGLVVDEKHESRLRAELPG